MSATKINDHVYKKLHRLFIKRKEGKNENDEYLRGLVSMGITESALIEEIGRRVAK